DAHEVCVRVVTEEPIPLRKLNPAVPRALETIVRTAMAKDIGERFTTADALAEELRRFLAGQPLSIPLPSPWARLGKWAAGHRAGLFMSGTSVVLCLALTVAVLVVKNQRIHRYEAVTRNLLSHVSRASEDLIQGMPPGSERTHSYYKNTV